MRYRVYINKMNLKTIMYKTKFCIKNSLLAHLMRCFMQFLLPFGKSNSVQCSKCATIFKG